MGAWKAGARMRDQGTSYTYTYNAFSRDGSRNTLMGGKSPAILQDVSRWPMLVDEPDRWGSPAMWPIRPPTRHPTSAA